jgi:glycosyltransferase involved in cell wall biosynthesis
MARLMSRAMGSRKKVLIACPLRGMGGVENHVLRVVRMLMEADADVTVVSRIMKPDAPIEVFRSELGLKFMTTPFSLRPNWPRAAMAWALYAWPRVLPHDFDLLYTLDASRLVCGLRRHLKPRARVIVNIVGEAAQGSWADPAAMRVFDAFVTETETQAAAYNVSIPKRAIPLMGLEAHPLPRPVRQSSDRLRVAYVGRYERAKGIFHLVDIWREARPKNAELAFYGIGLDRADLERYIESAELSDQAKVFDGWHSGEEQARIFSEIDLVVTPSESEGFPLVLLESMAHGVPFIASDVGAVREMTRDNPDVTVVPLDHAAFAAALLTMIDRLRRGELRSQRLRSYYRERYSPEHIAEQWKSALLSPEEFFGLQPVPAAADEAATYSTP